MENTNLQDFEPTKLSMGTEKLFLSR